MGLSLDRLGMKHRLTQPRQVIEMERPSNSVLAKCLRDFVEGLRYACFKSRGFKTLPKIRFAGLFQTSCMDAQSAKHASRADATLPPMFLHGDMPVLLPTGVCIYMRLGTVHLSISL